MALFIALMLECELKKNIPQQIIDTLEFLNHPGAFDETFENHPDHPFFKTDVWEYMLGESELTFDGTKKTYSLKVNSRIKDDEEQILKFLHWIAQYSKSKGIVGFIHPEDYYVPIRILFEKGRAYTIEPVENIRGLEEYSKPPMSKKLRGMIEGLRALIQDNPNLTPMLEQQIRAAEALAENKPGKELLNDPDFKSVVEMMNYFAKRRHPDLP